LLRFSFDLGVLRCAFSLLLVALVRLVLTLLSSERGECVLAHFLQFELSDLLALLRVV